MLLWVWLTLINHIFSLSLSFPRSSKSRLIELPCWGVLFPPVFSVFLSLSLPDSHIIYCFSTDTSWSQIWAWPQRWTHQFIIKNNINALYPFCKEPGVFGIASYPTTPTRTAVCKDLLSSVYSKSSPRWSIIPVEC